MAVFTGFKPSGMQKIANRLGYSGDMVNFDNYLQQNPEKQRQMIVFEDAARKMAEGGVATAKPITGNKPSDIEEFPIAEVQPIPQTPTVDIPEVTTPVMPPPAPKIERMPQQVDIPTGLPQPPKTGTFTLDPRENTRRATPIDPRTSFDPNAGFGRPKGSFKLPKLGQAPSVGGRPIDLSKLNPEGLKFRQPGDLGRYVAFNDEGMPGYGFMNYADFARANPGAPPPPKKTTPKAPPKKELTYFDRERLRQQADRDKKQAANYNIPQTFIDANYKTNDGTKFVLPFEPDSSNFIESATEEDYRNYLAKEADDYIRQEQERRKVLEISGYIENPPDERGYIYYTKPGSNARIGMTPRITDVNAFKQDFIQKRLQERKEALEREANLPKEFRFRSRFGDELTPEEMANTIAGAKQRLQETNKRLVETGLQPIDSGYYDSPEFKYLLENPARMRTEAYVFSPFFGMQSSGDGGREDSAYAAYLKRTGKQAVLDNATKIRQNYDAGNFNPFQGEPAIQDIPAQGTLQDNIKPAERQNPITGNAMNRQLATQPIPTQSIADDSDITDVAAQKLSSPGLPTGTQIQGVGIGQEAGQFIPTDQGQVTGSVAVPTSQATTTMAELPVATDANLMYPVGTTDAINTTLNATQAAQTNPADQRAQITAAQQTASSVGNLQAAQGNATLLNSPVQRQIQAGELVSGVANAQTASAFTEQIQAATASPSEKATVQGQLASLYANFDATNPPAWAAGALRSVQSVMQQRGLGASSIAAQAMVQGALESAIPIAQADARTVATFEAQNLSNRQQRAMLSAQQRAAFIGQEFDQAFQARVQNSARIADVANRNFTADQQIALENSRIANTMNLQNLSNQQALVIAEASALANMDLSNLNNRQQAAVQNAQTFLQQDMANLSNQQQVELFKAQQRVQSLFTDQAAQNAASQFNASSQNQVDQFFANLITQSSQFNATQANAQSQYNAGQRNVLERFNAELNNQRDTFNAQNRLIIDQNNAQWRRQIATADTATTNRINELNANNLLNISNLAYNNLWQYYADTMEWAWTSAENELNRYADMAIANLNADTQNQVAKKGASTAAGSAIGSLIGTLGSAYIGATFCWVAREVYGKGDPRWFVFRMWIKYKAPKWFKNLYKKHGEAYASYISNKPILKWVTKKFMDFVIKEKGKALECQAG